MIAHRIIRKVKDKNNTLFITKGDASIHCDKPVEPSLVIGKVVQIKKAYFTIFIDNIAGEIINLFMLFISLTRVIPFGLIVFRRIKYLSLGWVK